MNRLKKIVLLVLFILGLLIMFGTWYKFEYSMDKVAESTINTPELERSLLIATQGSEFKNAITNNIVNEFKKDSIFIRIIDISALTQVEARDYSAILLIHTWENWKPPMGIKEFIERTTDQKDKVVVMTTSGEGSSKIKNVDAITGESKIENVIPFTERAIERLKPLLSMSSNLNQ